MKAVLRLVYTYFTCTPAQKVFSAVGAVLVVGSTVWLASAPQSGFINVMALVGVASLFIGSSMMPLMFGRLARGHMSRTLPGARLKLLLSALITILIVAFSVPLELGVGLGIATGPPHLHASATQIAKWQKNWHDDMVRTLWITYSLSILLAFWLYVALWFITSKRNTVGYLQGLIVIAVVILSPTRQIIEPEALVRWDLTLCGSTLFTFSALFLLWPQLRLAADRLGLGNFIDHRRYQSARTRGREIDLLLGTANPWLLAVGQLLPVLLAARIGFYSAAVWLFYLTIFSTVASAIAGQAAERSRSLWLRGDWSTVQLFSRVERSFWRHNNYVLGILLILMVAIGSYANLPVMLLATGLPLLILGTILSTYLGLMITRGLRWSESLLAIGVMLALMAVAVLAARNSNDLLIVIILEAALALVALILRFVARARWARIDWMQCRTDRALTGRSAA
jgi:hypothetical protein